MGPLAKTASRTRGGLTDRKESVIRQHEGTLAVALVLVSIVTSAHDESRVLMATFGTFRPQSRRKHRRRFNSFPVLDFSFAFQVICGCTNKDEMAAPGSNLLMSATGGRGEEGGEEGMGSNLLMPPSGGTP